MLPRLERAHTRVPGRPPSLSIVHPPLRLLAIGDDYTAHEPSWPQATERRLALVRRAVETTVIAEPGADVRTLLERFAARGLPGEFDVAVVSVGAIDHRSGRTVPQFADDLRALGEIVLDVLGGRTERLVLLSIPDWARAPFGKAHLAKHRAPDVTVGAFNAALRNMAHGTHAGFVDVGRLADAAADQGNVAADGYHYLPIVYEAWAEEIAPAVLSASSLAQALE